jgi:hypothetical protein
MSALDLPSGSAGPLAARQGLLPPALQRDLADLNGLYLELGLASAAEDDPRFAWPASVAKCLRELDASTLARLGAGPFALFEIVIPEVNAPLAGDRVEDGRIAARPGSWQARCDSFAHQAAFLARRLVEGEPLVARVVLGLSHHVQQQLADWRLPQLADMARSPDLIRPRWRLHPQFWQMLVGAARRDSPRALHWAHCIGVCLIGAEDGAGAVPPRPPPR